MESVIGLFKTECIRTTVFHDKPYRTINDVEFATAGWVDWWNNRRLHGTLGMMTPTEVEQHYHATLNRDSQRESGRKPRAIQHTQGDGQGVGHQPNTCRESPEHPSGINRLRNVGHQPEQYKTWCAARDLNPEPAD